MPSYRGIEVSVLAHLVAGQLPEYPHPDGSSLRHNVPDDESRLPPTPLKHDETRSKQSNSVVSVYIPSAPGSQFWINYIVKQEVSPPCHLFFKLYMNGRHITSWGINPRVKRAGRAEKALYEPSERWDQEENGIRFKPEGIEARYFHFVGGQPEKTVAEDGGIIEVQVFRAKGRKRRAAKLDQYRHQDRYGITAPSGGLLDNPQDVTFFDFHLIDPKDAPFATFRFHYRSMKNLLQLNLIPSENPENLQASRTGKISEDSVPSSPQKIKTAEEPSIEVPSLSIHLNSDASVFDDNHSSGGHDSLTPEGHRPRRNSCYVLQTPPQLRPRSATSHILPQPSKTLRDGIATGCPDSILQRPLPDRPLPELPAVSPDDIWLGPSRKSSNASATPSIAPSLMSYVKNESFLNETVEYGQAQALHMEKDHPGVPTLQGKMVCSPNNRHSSGGDGVILDADSLQHNDRNLASPGTHAPSPATMPESTVAQIGEIHTASSGNAVAVQQNKNLTTESVTTRSRDLALDFAKFPHLQLSEAEWKRRTPSPQLAPRRILSPRLGRLWSTLRRNKSRSPLRGVHNELAPRNYSTPQLTGSEVKERHGNWI